MTILPPLFYALNYSYNCMKASRTNQESSEVEPLVMAGAIGRNGFRMSWNIYGYIPASSEAHLTDFRRSSGSSGLSISFLLFLGYSARQYIHCARSLRVGQWNPISISFQKVITQHSYGESFSLVGISSSHPNTLNAHYMCNSANTPASMEGSSANSFRFMACIAGGDAALRLDRQESSFVRPAISNLRQHFT